jgi:hypothetical protein
MVKDVIVLPFGEADDAFLMLCADAIHSLQPPVRMGSVTRR